MTALGFGLTLAAASSWALGNIVNRQIAQRVTRGAESGGLVRLDSAFAFLSLFLSVRSGLFSAAGTGYVGSELVCGDLSGADRYGFRLWPVGQVTESLSCGAGLSADAGCACGGAELCCSVTGEELQPLQWGGIVLVLLGLGLNTWGAPLLSRWRTAA